MSDSTDNDAHAAEGTTELEQALLSVETELDGIFGAAERAGDAGEDDAGLILEQLLDLIYENFSPQIPYDRIGMAIVENDGGVVRSRWARSEAESITIGTGHAAPLQDAVVRDVLRDGEPLIINDLEAYLAEHEDSEPTRYIVDEGMRSALTCPLIADQEPIGLMVFSSEQPDAYEERHKQMFAHVAGHVAAILERSRLYERLGELNWQLRVARDALAFQATHDGLTRLLNRTAILELAERELDRAGRQDKPITIVMCDIDRFKRINDTHGHLVGDEVLQAVADRLAAALRSYETVGRFGGEEFLITLYDCSAEGAPHALERLRNAVGHEPVATEAGDVPVSISLGGATGSGDDIAVDNLIRAADEAMYEAKKAGRDCHRVRTVENKE